MIIFKAHQHEAAGMILITAATVNSLIGRWDRHIPLLNSYGQALKQKCRFPYDYYYTQQVFTRINNF